MHASEYSVRFELRLTTPRIQVRTKRSRPDGQCLAGRYLMHAWLSLYGTALAGGQA